MFSLADYERPDAALWPEWSADVYAGWQALRDDRHHGAYGGIRRIWFTAIERYAAAHDIAGAAFDEFVTFVRAIDDVYVEYVNAKHNAAWENRNK